MGKIWIPFKFHGASFWQAKMQDAWKENKLHAITVDLQWVCLKLINSNNNLL